MNEFRREPEELVEAEVHAVREVIRSGWWILGRQVEAFESEWAGSCSAKHAIGVANGMDALEIGLRALGIGRGDEVITTSMTAFASALAIIRSGAEPVFADIDPDTAMLNVESVARCISPRTRAIMLVHLYGQVGSVHSLSRLAEDRGIYLVEDCAQAHGARLEGRPVGSFGVFAGWSFYPTKNLGAVGDAGALTTNSDELAGKACSLRNYGQTVRYHHPMVGLNSRLDEIQAAILRQRLPYLDRWIARRRKIAQAYAAGIRNSRVRVLPLPRDIASHVYHLFVLVTDKRDELQAHLKKKEVESLCHYPVPVHQQIPCKGMQCDPKGMVKTEAHALGCLSLPCHPGLSDPEVSRVIEAVNAYAVTS
jgi:dTDP-4-amino-4,6-dideoxygalactose transaminase